MTKQEAETLLISVQAQIKEQGRIVNARLIDKERQLKALIQSYEREE